MEIIEKTTLANSVKNFLVSNKFKNITKEKPKRNQMKHLIPKKNKRKK